MISRLSNSTHVQQLPVLHTNTHTAEVSRNQEIEKFQLPTVSYLLEAVAYFLQFTLASIVATSVVAASNFCRSLVKTAQLVVQFGLVKA